MVSLYPILQLYSRMVPCSAPLGVTTPCTRWYLVMCARSVVLSAHLDCAVAGVRHVIWRQAHHVIQGLAGQLGRLTYADRRLLGVPHSGAGAAVDILPEQPQQRVALIAVVPAKFQFGSKLSAVYRLPCNGPNIKLLGELPFNRQHIGLLPTVPLRQIVPENDCKLYS